MATATGPDEQTLLLGPAPTSHVEGASKDEDKIEAPRAKPLYDIYDSNLIRYREAVGISSTYGENADLESARETAKGIYKQIIDLQTTKSWQYRVVDTFYYAALGLQVIIGAVLASLGPESKSHGRIVTVFGVLNSCTAGIIALLKGQGLPDRLRKDEYNLRLVQDFIEETDMRLAIRGNDITRARLQELVEEVFSKYHTARDQAAAAKPNSMAPRRTAVPQVDGPGHGTPSRKSNDRVEDVKGKRNIGFERRPF